MTEIAPIPGPGDANIGPGRLVLIVGPSGAGKDTLIDLAREVCADDSNVVFARRVVTRESSVFENNVQVTPEAFGIARAAGEFAVDWEAHGLCYALPRGIDDEIRDGRCVVANISRAVVPRLRSAYANVTVVLITAPPEVLAARLVARGRASDGPIGERLNRAANHVTADVTIQNTGHPRERACELVRVINGR